MKKIELDEKEIEVIKKDLQVGNEHRDHFVRINKGDKNYSQDKEETIFDINLANGILKKLGK